MIIYKDIINDDELMSDTYNMKETEDGMLYEVDCTIGPKKNEQIELAGANPSAEGGDDEGVDDGSTGEMVYNIQEGFQLNWLKDTKPSKDFFKAHLKAYVKKVNNKLKEKGTSEEEIKKFQAGAAAVVKKLLKNYDNYDVLMGSSMDADGMHVLIDFREDGVTPYATLWKHGLVGMKV